MNKFLLSAAVAVVVVLCVSPRISVSEPSVVKLRKKLTTLNKKRSSLFPKDSDACRALRVHGSYYALKKDYLEMIPYDDAILSEDVQALGMDIDILFNETGSVAATKVYPELLAGRTIECNGAPESVVVSAAVRVAHDFELANGEMVDQEILVAALERVGSKGP